MFSTYTISKKRHPYNFYIIAQFFYFRKINLNWWKTSTLCAFGVIFEELNIEFLFRNAKFLTHFLFFVDWFVKNDTIPIYIFIQICKITSYLFRKYRLLSIFITNRQLTFYFLKRNNFHKHIAINFRAPSE